MTHKPSAGHPNFGTKMKKSKIGAIVAERSPMGPSFLPTIIVAT